ncbi:MAG: hypothetical protein LBU85_07955, partial [Treponema sp.]|nr:hypothetical protein [Treponema sp.]
MRNEDLGIRNRRGAGNLRNFSNFLLISHFLFLITHFLFISCATVSPVEEPEKRTVFAIPDEVSPRWSALSSGLDYFAGKVSRPRVRFYALRIDLTEPEVRIT